MTGRLVLGMAFAFAAWIAAAPSQAQSASKAVSAEMAAPEWSATKKKRHAVRSHTRPAYAYHAPRYGRAADPAFGPNGLLYRRPYDLGGCIIDEGYGRFTTCSNR